MTDDSNGTPPIPEHPAKFVTMTDIERIIDRLELPRNVVKNTEGALTDLMPRLERLEDQFKTFSNVWADSIDTRKQQLDRIEKDLSGDSEKITAISGLIQSQIDLQVSNEERIRLMQTLYDRDLYGGTVKGGDTVMPGLITTVRAISDMIMRQAEAIRLIERRMEKEEALTEKYRRRDEMIRSGVIKAIPLGIRLLAGLGGATGLSALLLVVLKILGG